MFPRKKIKSRYKVAKVNSNYYAPINVSGTTNQVFTGTTCASGTTSQGYIFMPYVMAQSGTTINMEESPEMKAERNREERKKKIERIFKDLS